MARIEAPAARAFDRLAVHREAGTQARMRPTGLSAAQLDTFHRESVVFPQRALEEIQRYRDQEASPAA